MKSDPPPKMIHLNWARPKCRPLLLAALLLPLVTLPGQTTYYWDTNGATAGATSNGDGSASGGWLNSTWTTNAAGDSSTTNYANPPIGINDIAVFSAGSTVNLATGSSTIAIGASGDINLSRIVIEEGTMNFTSTGAKFVFRGTDTVNLAASANGNATFSSDITLSSGFPTQTWTNANATANLVFNNRIRISGLTSQQATITLSNTSSGGTIFNGQVGTGDISDPFPVLRVTNLVVNNTGTGVTTFNAANPYTGSTQITAGTLLISGSGSINATSGVTVNGAASVFRYDSSTALTRTVAYGSSGGTFLYNSGAKYTGGGGSLTAGTDDSVGGDGVLGNVTIANGGTLVPGELGNAGTGNLTLDSLILQAGATSNFGVANAGSFDSIFSAGALTLGGTLNLTFDSVLADGSNLSLFNGGSYFSNFTSILAMGAYSGSFALEDDLLRLQRAGQLLTFNHNSGMLTVTAIPEPSSMVVLGGSLMAMILFRRARLQ